MSTGLIRSWSNNSAGELGNDTTEGQFRALHGDQLLINCMKLHRYLRLETSRGRVDDLFVK